MTMPAPPAAVGIVLAGGASRRMRPAPPPSPTVFKEWIEIGGRTLLERVVEVVSAETVRTFVVAAPDRPLPPLPRAVKVVHDTAPGAGPLAALLDGLGAIGPDEPASLAFVSSCDVPLLKREVVRFLLDRTVESGADWTVPEIGGHPQVLCSVVRRSLWERFAAWSGSGRRDPRGLLAVIRQERGGRACVVTPDEIAAVDPRADSFRDIDTPEAFAEIRRQLTYGDRGGATYTSPP